MQHLLWAATHVHYRIDHLKETAYVPELILFKLTLQDYFRTMVTATKTRMTMIAALTTTTAISLAQIY